MKPGPRRVENYTTAFLVTAWGILFMAFFTLAALGGLPLVVLAAAGVEGAIRSLARLRR